jgi:hypothetical protein
MQVLKEIPIRHSESIQAFLATYILEYSYISIKDYSTSREEAVKIINSARYRDSRFAAVSKNKRIFLL